MSSQSEKKVVDSVTVHIEIIGHNSSDNDLYDTRLFLPGTTAEVVEHAITKRYPCSNPELRMKESNIVCTYDMVMEAGEYIFNGMEVMEVIPEHATNDMRMVNVNLTSNQCPLTEVGTVWDIENFSYSCLSTSDTLRSIYVREECVRLWRMLDSLVPNDILFVDGAPGVGKSTLVYGWLMHMAASKNVLWVDKGFDGVSYLKLNKPNGIPMSSTVVTKNSDGTFNQDSYCAGSYSFTRSNSSASSASEVVENVTEFCRNVDILVLDGFTANYVDILKPLVSKRDTIMIGISSFSATSYFASSHYEEIYNNHNKCIRRHRMNSWSYDEYVTVYNNSKLLNQHFTDIAALNERYYYAGGSMRYMCMHKSIVLLIVGDSMSMISDFNSLLDGLSGDTTSTSINMIMSCFNGRSLPLSHYITRKLSQLSLTREFLVALKSIFIDNHIYSWVLELEFLYDLRHCRLQFVDASGDSLTFEENARFQYFHDEEDVTKNPTSHMSIWYVPLSFTSKESYNLLYMDGQEVHIFQICDDLEVRFNWNSIIPILMVLLRNLKSYQIKYNLLLIKPRNNMQDIRCWHKNYDDFLAKYASNWNSDSKIDSICNCYYVINCFNTRTKTTSTKAKMLVPNVIYDKSNSS